MPTTWITSHLALGDMPYKVSGLRLRADSPGVAAKIIEAGGTAVLPAEDFDAAAQTLRLLGATEDHIRWMVYTSCRDLRSLSPSPVPFALGEDTNGRPAQPGPGQDLV